MKIILGGNLRLNLKFYDGYKPSPRFFDTSMLVDWDALLPSGESGCYNVEINWEVAVYKHICGVVFGWELHGTVFDFTLSGTYYLNFEYHSS